MQKETQKEVGLPERLKELEKSLIEKLGKAGVELSENAVCRIYLMEVIIETATENPVRFADKLSFYAFRTENGEIKNSIILPFSGTFTPENKPEYWRTVHAASILKNWDKACKVINRHVSKYRKLHDLLQKQNQEKL